MGNVKASGPHFLGLNTDSDGGGRRCLGFSLPVNPYGSSRTFLRTGTGV